MVIVTVLYLAIVWLLFFKLKWLPWNGLTKGLTTLVGVVILTAFLVGLQGLTPSSTQAMVTGRILEIAPQVSGRINTVSVEPNVVVEVGAVLLTIDPIPFEARVQELEARSLIEMSNGHAKLFASSFVTFLREETSQAGKGSLLKRIFGKT